MGRPAGTEPQCLYKGDLYLYYFTCTSIETDKRHGNRYRPKYETMTSDLHSCYLSALRCNIRRERR